MHLSRLFRYPLKSGADEALDTATVTARGLLGDRRWMVVDDDGEFLTGRRFPQLVRVCARLARGSLQLRAPGQTDCRVSEPRAGGERTAVTVWGDRVAALDAGDSAAAWITALLRIPARLVFMDEAAQRDVDPAFALPGDTVSFADGFPLLPIGSASMADLNRRVGRSMDPRRFRPNLLVDTPAPFTEDRWRRIRIGEIVFDVVKACSRCRFTTVDPDSGERDADGEPLRTLARFRAAGDGVLFGQNLIPRTTGTIRVGDELQVLDGD